MAKKNLFDVLAKKGRGKDSKLAFVNGELSHVEPDEETIIAALGPLGEAWVQNIGRGTTNPQTGLKEYGTWRPSQGKWGIFGSTKKSKKRDLVAASKKARKDAFKAYMLENKKRNYT